jgi:hypothetical protein
LIDRAFFHEWQGPFPKARRPRLRSRAAGYHRGFHHDHFPVHAMPSSAVSARLAGHALVEALIAQGVDTVFGVPNDTQSQLCDAVAEESALGRGWALHRQWKVRNGWMPPLHSKTKFS